MSTLYLSLGSNRGDRLENLRRAAGLIGERVGAVTGLSPVFETPPWGFADPISFYNCCIGVSTVHSPESVMKMIIEIEVELGRMRGEKSKSEDPTKRYQSRTIDIDILFYNDIILNAGDLVIPHPGIANRRFVLEPLIAICPEFIHPVLNKSVSDLLVLCPDTSVVLRIPDTLR